MTAILALVMAAASVSVTPEQVVPGGLVMVDVRGVDDPQALSGHLFGKSLHFFTSGRHHQRAYAGVDLEADPDTLDVEVTWKGAHRRVLATQVEVIDKEFNQSELKVSHRFLAPTAADKAHIKEDTAQIKAAYAGVTFGPALFHGKFSMPKKDPEITAHFGDQRLFNGKLKSKHQGTDFDGKIGDPILAAAEGEVILARECFMSGNTVILNHGGGLYTSYFHMSRMDVKPGDRVERGQQLGLVGKTGRVTGPHLHFGVKVGSRQVDAEEAFKLELGLDPGWNPPAPLPPSPTAVEASAPEADGGRVDEVQPIRAAPGSPAQPRADSGGSTSTGTER